MTWFNFIHFYIHRDQTDWPRISEQLPGDGAGGQRDQNDSGHGEDSQMADFGRAQSSVLFQVPIHVFFVRFVLFIYFCFFEF